MFAAIGSAVFLRERLGRSKMAGISLALVGIVLITTNGELGAAVSGQLLGDALFVVAAVSWAGYIVYAKKMSDEQGWDPLAAAACIVAATTALVIPSALLGGFGLIVSADAVWPVLYTAILNTVTPFAPYQHGLAKIPAGNSALVLTLEIVVAIALSAILLRENLTGIQWVGAVAVLGSILFVSGVEIRGKSLSVNQDDAGVEATW